MPSSPHTPDRRRHSSVMDLSLPASPQSNGFNSQTNNFSPRTLAHSRRTSLYSIPSPSTHRPGSSHNRRSSGAVSDFGGAIDHDNELGNLADELAEAWDEDGEGIPEVGGLGSPIEGQDTSYNGDLTVSQESQPCSQPDSPAMSSGPSTLPSSSDAPSITLSPTKHLTRQKSTRNRSQYGEPDCSSDFESEDAASISPSLEARMAAIESLARWGTESNCSDASSIVRRFADSLKDLGSQSGLEDGATGLIAAQNALTTNLTHQGRLLQNLAHPLFSPLSHPPDADAIDPLISTLTSLTLLIPTPTSKPLTAFLQLRSSTTDFLSTLSGLSDTLHMVRQTTALASRRLNASREMVAGLRREAEAREESIRWIEKERWGDRLARRECAQICSDVVGGFEEVCRGWRERLFADGVAGMEVEVCAG